jgi:hypothetical protein
MDAHHPSTFLHSISLSTAMGIDLLRTIWVLHQLISSLYPRIRVSPMKGNYDDCQVPDLHGYEESVAGDEKIWQVTDDQDSGSWIQI